MKIARAVQDVETRRLKEESGRLEKGIKKAEEEIRESLRTIAFFDGVYWADQARNQELGIE